MQLISSYLHLALYAPFTSIFLLRVSKGFSSHSSLEIHFLGDLPSQLLVGRTIAPFHHGFDWYPGSLLQHLEILGLLQRFNQERP
jgi:hypothetical protein